MTKGEALARVASHVAGNLLAGDLEEASGLFDYEISDADAERIDWAMGEVARRLYRMGNRKEVTS